MKQCSSLPDGAIDEKIISGQDGDKQNDPTEDPTVEENDLPGITDAEGSVLEFQEKTCEEDVPSTEMVREIPRSPICAQRENKITEKRQIVKINLQTKSYEMTRLTRKKFHREKLARLKKFECRMLIVEDVIQEISWGY